MLSMFELLFYCIIDDHFYINAIYYCIIQKIILTVLKMFTQYWCFMPSKLRSFGFILFVESENEIRPKTI